ncbi:MAG: WG repeat-containing protein [Prevotella sp.]|nr:WG repeat-containing protein [Prevotella sp.]
MKYLMFILIFFFYSIFGYSQIVDAQEGDNGKYGFVDKKGNWVIQPIYYSTYWDKSNLYGKFFEEEHVGAVNKNGEIVFSAMYKDVSMFYNDELNIYIINLENDKYSHFGVCNNDFKIIIPVEYEEINVMQNGFGVKTTEGFYGYFDCKGKTIIPANKYNYIERDCNYFIGCIGDYGILEIDGNKFINSDNICFLDLNGNELVSSKLGYTSGKVAGDNIFLVEKNGKFGYYANGQEIIPCQYDEATIFTNNVATVKKDGQVMLIKNPLKDGSEIQIAENGSASKKKIIGPAVSRYPAPSSDVDKNIPAGKQTNENMFAFIIANENYPDAPVPYSLNDGRIFKEYCNKTLGIPEKNINMYEDATFGNIITAVEKMKSIADAYDGEASVIFYYAGHGFPDEKQNTAYLLPIDGNASDITTTGYSLAKLYKDLAALKLKSSVVFLDACFSGAKREDNMLASSRGVAIKVKEETPQGNMIVFSAAQGDETAHQLEEKGHGLFTYYLLKGLQQTEGNITLGELSDIITKQVKRQSVVINNKKQTPTVIPSQSVISSWQSMKLK